MSIRLAVVVWTAGLMAAVAAAAVAASGGRIDDAVTELGLPLASGLAFIAAGLVAWTRRPENRTGLLMTAVGFTWFLGALNWSGDPLLFTLGAAVSTVAFGFFIWLLLAFPSGRLEERLDRRLVAAAFVVVLALPPAQLLFDDPRVTPTCDECPANVFLVSRQESVAEALGLAFAVGAAAIAIGVIGRLGVRYRRATPPSRQVVRPVYATAGVLLVLGLVTATLPLLVGEWILFDRLIFVGLLAVPISFVYGLLRERLARAAVERLVVQLGERPGPGDLRQALARALGDPSLALLHYDPDLGRFLDDTGREVELAGVGGRRTATVVERNGQPLGALIHDVSLLDNRHLLDSVTATAGLAFETERRYQDLRRAKDRNAALLGAIPDLIFRIGMDGVYRQVKAENVDDLVYAPEEIVGASVHDLLPREVSGRIMECALRARESGAVEALEYRLDLGGRVRDLEGRIVYAGEDEFVLIVRDVTHRKRQEDELRASRARIVEAGDAARRRLERDLHDGAQQRLVALSVALRLAQSRLRDDPGTAETILAGAAEELTQALGELRELARGIHPAILSDRGLAPALEALASRSPVPVEVEVPPGRLPSPVEAAAYFVVSEALANAAKHAGAAAVSVRVAAENGAVVVDVADDGAGGADPANGTGLRGLADRVAALDGTLAVESPTGGGTTVRAVLPLPGVDQ